jgi:hypothetical protein
VTAQKFHVGVDSLRSERGWIVTVHTGTMRGNTPLVEMWVVGVASSMRAKQIVMDATGAPVVSQIEAHALEPSLYQALGLKRQQVRCYRG